MNPDLKKNRRLYPFTILWVVAFIASLALSIWTAIPSDKGLALTLALGIPLTVLLALDWSIHLPNRKLTFWLAVSGTAWWAASALLVRSDFDWRIWHSVNTLSLLVVTFSVGLWLAGEIEKSGHLIPVCILGTLVDFWSVFHGPSKQVGQQIIQHQQQVVETGIQGPPPIVDFFILHWPYPGANMMATLFGMGDLVFVAMFIGSARRFGLSLPKAVLLVLGGLIAATATAMYFNKPIPALPFMCAFFLAGNYRALALTRREWTITISMAAVIIALILANYFGSLITSGK